MKRLVCAVSHSHSWLFSQVFLACLKRYPPLAEGYEVKVIVADNSWDWSPSIRGVKETSLGEGVEVVNNPKTNKFHASGLDHIIENYEFDLFMALETDVAALKPGWLQWFVNQMETDARNFAVGHWHHEQFVNPSCTLYRGQTLRDMLKWCKDNKSTSMRWGHEFGEELLAHESYYDWVSGPFAEKRGWPEGTVLTEKPSGQLKGPGWYEPGQQLYHWAKQNGWNHVLCENTTVWKRDGLPVGTYYGHGGGTPPDVNLQINQMWGLAYIVHLWGGTRALDIIKHKVPADDFVAQTMSFWLNREATFWLQSVPEDVQKRTIELIKQYGWHYKGQGTPDTTDRDREAAKLVESYYRQAGIPI